MYVIPILMAALLILRGYFSVAMQAQDTSFNISFINQGPTESYFLILEMCCGDKSSYLIIRVDTKSRIFFFSCSVCVCVSFATEEYSAFHFHAIPLSVNSMKAADIMVYESNVKSL